MMGVTLTATVVTSSEGRAEAKKIQPGNREWVKVIQGLILKVGTSTICSCCSEKPSCVVVSKQLLMITVGQQMRRVWIGFDISRSTQSPELLVFIAC
jgi:hypothetical protein